MPLLFVQNLGLAPEYLAGLYSVVAALTITGPLIAKKVANKHRFGKSLFGLLFVVAVSVMAFAASGSIAFAIFTFAIIKISEAIFDTVIISARQHKYDSKIRASLGSLISLVWAISNSVGVFLTGFGIKYLGVMNTLMISGVIMFLTAFVFLWLKE
jgi:predicted MFS family arabinose efflux permease